MILINGDIEDSRVFVIPSGKQVTLSAYGLSDADAVVVEIVRLEAGKSFSGDPCDQTRPQNISVVSATPLLCASGAPVNLTRQYPYAVIDAPQTVPLRARIISLSNTPVIVEYAETKSMGELSDTCRPPLCASMPLDCNGGETGYGFHAVERDPLATVEMADCDGGDSIWIYPEAGRGHTVKVEDCEGNLVGYANNCPCSCCG